MRSRRPPSNTMSPQSLVPIARAATLVHDAVLSDGLERVLYAAPPTTWNHVKRIRRCHKR